MSTQIKSRTVTRLRQLALAALGCLAIPYAHARAHSALHASQVVRAKSGVSDPVDASTLTGKLIMGYQGWFNCPGDGTQVGWWHWFTGPDPTVDMLPNAADYPAAERCVTSLLDAGGNPVDLFSDADPSTVETQFAWMRQYGLDGVALQRFAVDLLDPPTRDARNIVLANVRQAAEDNGRVFFVMYDLTGLSPAKLHTVAADWRALEREGVTSSPAYLHHRGRPLLGVWGLGFAGRDLTPSDAESLLGALHKVSARYGGVTVLGSVPSYWRIGRLDASSDPKWQRVWRRLDVLSPWSVGRFSNEASADTYSATVWGPDLKATRALGVDYLPVLFPGYSFANTTRALGQPNPISNQIPRQCGRFYWRQVYDAMGAGATMLYGAMFDELNEGTAMFKMLPQASEAPVQGIPQGYSFVTLDADGCPLPSDWYLSLAGAATTAVLSGTQPSATLPLPIPSSR
ncbi:MAG TPA: glycoside hydrolase family 71/99-like protein [Candidatus Binataceae bacterium]|nr:glycoside hydrolase family 71/99-like protein [Candidatus Binataceae bacterium]